MLVSAYRDPVTGLLYETEEAFDKAVTQRKKKESEDKKREEFLQESQRMRDILAELSGIEDLPPLITQAVNFYFDHKKYKRGRAKPQVTTVEVKRFEVKYDEVQFIVRVNFTSTFDNCIQAAIFPPDFDDIFGLGDFKNSRRNADATWMEAAGSISLEKLPKLEPRYRRLVELDLAFRKHNDSIEKQRNVQADKDEEIQACLREEQALAAEIAKLKDQMAALTAKRMSRSASLHEQISKANPFGPISEFNQLKKSMQLS